MALPPEPTTAVPDWESVTISGSLSGDVGEGNDDDGQAGDREPLSPLDDPPELAAEV